MSINITRAAFVKKISEVDFDNGILLKFDINKPSEVDGGLEIPLDIAWAILSISDEFIQIKIDTTKRETTLIEAQKAQIETLIKLLQIQEKLRKLQDRKNKENKNMPDN